jgi:hypothetical protein
VGIFDMWTSSFDKKVCQQLENEFLHVVSEVFKPSWTFECGKMESAFLLQVTPSEQLHSE